MAEENKELKLLEDIASKVDASTKEGKEVKALVDQASKEVAETKKKAEELAEALSKKDATIV